MKTGCEYPRDSQAREDPDARDVDLSWVCNHTSRCYGSRDVRCTQIGYARSVRCNEKSLDVESRECPYRSDIRLSSLRDYESHVRVCNIAREVRGVQIGDSVPV